MFQNTNMKTPATFPTILQHIPLTITTPHHTFLLQQPTFPLQHPTSQRQHLTFLTTTIIPQMILIILENILVSDILAPPHTRPAPTHTHQAPIHTHLAHTSLVPTAILRAPTTLLLQHTFTMIIRETTLLANFIRVPMIIWAHLTQAIQHTIQVTTFQDTPQAIMITHQPHHCTNGITCIHLSHLHTNMTTILHPTQLIQSITIAIHHSTVQNTMTYITNHHITITIPSLTPPH